MSVLTAALYGLCLLFLAAAALLILAKNPRSRLHRHFALLLLALLGWVASLFVFGLPLGLQLPSAELLWLGRLNFACLVPAVTFGFLFVRDIAGQPSLPAMRWLWPETALIFILTLVTPFVDQAELVVAGQHVTLYGPLFVPYILHVVVFLAASLLAAFQPPPEALPDTRSQLRLIGCGALLTAAIALTTNVLLPYAFGNFHFIHVGTLSTILFLLAVSDAVFVHHLFDVRLVIRAAFVYAGLIALALELYGLALSFLARLLPLGSADERHYAATALVLVVNAFTQGAIRRWLERILNHPLCQRRTAEDAGAVRQVRHATVAER